MCWLKNIWYFCLKCLDALNYKPQKMTSNLGNYIPVGTKIKIVKNVQSQQTDKNELPIVNLISGDEVELRSDGIYYTRKIDLWNDKDKMQRGFKSIQIENSLGNYIPVGTNSENSMQSSETTKDEFYSDMAKLQKEIVQFSEKWGDCIGSISVVKDKNWGVHFVPSMAHIRLLSGENPL